MRFIDAAKFRGDKRLGRFPRHFDEFVHSTPLRVGAILLQPSTPDGWPLDARWAVGDGRQITKQR